MILNKQLTPAEGEQCVKTYHCTSFRSKLLGIDSEGYLEITSRRVVFQAAGSNSIIHSEVPIEDVSGISVYKGRYFSIMHLVGALLLGVIAGGLISTIVGVLIGLITSGDAAWLNWLIAVGFLAGSVAINRQNIWRPTCAVASSVSLLLAAGSGLLGRGLFGGNTYGYGYGGMDDYSGLALAASAAMGIYAIVCMIWYANRKTMSLAVNSKGGSQTPIAIAGAGGSSVIYSNAARALSAEPAQDAEAVSRELGAIIMDIQQLGDAAVQKWQVGSTS